MHAHTRPPKKGTKMPFSNTGSTFWSNTVSDTEFNYTGWVEAALIVLSEPNVAPQRIRSFMHAVCAACVCVCARLLVPLHNRCKGAERWWRYKVQQGSRWDIIWLNTLWCWQHVMYCIEVGCSRGPWTLVQCLNVELIHLMWLLFLHLKACCPFVSRQPSASRCTAGAERKKGGGARCFWTGALRTVCCSRTCWCFFTEKSLPYALISSFNSSSYLAE